MFFSISFQNIVFNLMEAKRNGCKINISGAEEWTGAQTKYFSEKGGGCSLNFDTAIKFLIT